MVSATREGRLEIVRTEPRALTAKEERLAYFVMSELVNGRIASFRAFMKGESPRVELIEGHSKIIAPE